MLYCISAEVELAVRAASLHCRIPRIDIERRALKVYPLGSSAPAHHVRSSTKEKNRGGRTMCARLSWLIVLTLTAGVSGTAGVKTASHVQEAQQVSPEAVQKVLGNYTLQAIEGCKRVVLNVQKKIVTTLAQLEYNIGEKYYYGGGLFEAPERPLKAVKWIRRAAEKGLPKAQLRLGEICLYGRGVPKDNKLGLDWVLKAAEQGLAEAQNYLGRLYEGFSTTGIPADPVKSAEWYRRAAEQGDPDGQFSLGCAYTEGEGVPKDLARAAELFAKAAAQGDRDAQLALASAYLKGQGVAKNPARAVDMYRELASRLDDPLYSTDVAGEYATFYLGNMYREGQGVPKNEEAAAMWYRKIAEAPSGVCCEDAKFMLATMYLEGKGVPKDLTQAVVWFRKAAERGHVSSQHNLGIMYANGLGIGRDCVQAYLWLNLAGKREEQSRHLRDSIAHEMSVEQIAEAQALSSKWVPEWLRPEYIKEAMSKSSKTEEEPPASPELPAIACGTGFFITNDGCLITSNHVLSDATSFMVRIGDNTAPAKLLKRDVANDLALLQTSLTSEPIPLGNSGDVGMGDSVFTVGYPNVDIQGLAPKMTRGEVNSIAGPGDDSRFFQISVQVQPGNSGGPLVDMKGNVVGIVTMKLDDAATVKYTGNLPQNVNYAVKSSYLKALIEGERAIGNKLIPPIQKAPKDFRDVVEHVSRATAIVIVKKVNQPPPAPAPRP